MSGRTSGNWRLQPLRLAELVYYSLFIHAIAIHFFGDGLRVVGSGIQFDKLTAAPDQIIARSLWALCFLCILGFAAFQFVRVYARIGVDDETIAEAYPALKNDDFNDGAYYRRFGRLIDWLLRCLALVVLLDIEHRSVARLTTPQPDTFQEFWKLWVLDIGSLYFVLGMYSLLIALPRWRKSQNKAASSQAGGWFITDLLMIATWALFGIGLWFAAHAVLVPLVCGVGCMVLMFFVWRTERGRPLLEPSLRYLQQYSIGKSMLSVSLIIVVFETLEYAGGAGHVFGRGVDLVRAVGSTLF